MCFSPTSLKREIITSQQMFLLSATSLPPRTGLRACKICLHVQHLNWHSRFSPHHLNSAQHPQQADNQSTDSLPFIRRCWTTPRRC